VARFLLQPSQQQSTVIVAEILKYIQEFLNLWRTASCATPQLQVLHGGGDIMSAYIQILFLSRSTAAVLLCIFDNMPCFTLMVSVFDAMLLRVLFAKRAAE